MSEAADVEDSNSVHGFGYCIRDRRHVPAAEPLVFANSEGLYDNKLQRSGPKAAAALDLLGKREQLPDSTKGSQVSPCLAEVIVKKLDLPFFE